jgi:PAS domain-containing protein
LHHHLSPGRRSTEQSLRRDCLLLDAVLAGVEEIILACGSDGAISHASRGARDLLGAAGSPESAPEARVEHLNPRTPEGLPLAVPDLPLMRALREQRAHESEVLIDTARGEMRMRASARPLDPERPLGAIVRLAPA